MKKRLLLFAFTIATSSAFAVRPISNDNIVAGKAPRHNIEFNTDVLTPVPQPGKLVKRTHSRAEESQEVSMTDFQGEFDWYYYTPYDFDGDGDPDEQYATVMFTLEDEATGKVSIELKPDLAVVAYIDLDNNTITVPNMQYLGKDADGDIYFYFKAFDEDYNIIKGPTDAKEMKGTLEGTEISFPIFDLWAMGTPDYEVLGFYFLAFANEFVPGLKWESLGQGSFMENITYSLCIGTSTINNKYTDVEVFRCLNYPGYYKVADPLKASYSLVRLNSQSPDLIFIAEDPENIIVTLTESDLGNDTYGGIYYFSQSFLIELGYDLENVKKITLTRSGDDATITCIPGSLMLFMEYITTGYFNCAGETILKFKEHQAGVENVAVEDSNAPVEYFNLQGMRVANPDNGIYIRRQGNTATKVRF